MRSTEPDHSSTAPAGARPWSIARDEVLGELIEEVVRADRAVAAAQAQRLRAIEAARDWAAGSVAHLAPGAPAPDLDDPRVRANLRVERDLAERSFVSEVACALRMPEITAGNLVEHARTLVHELPATLEVLGRGEITERHTEVVVEHTVALDRTDRAALESRLLERATVSTVTGLRKFARRERERTHPRPLQERHREKLLDRQVQIDPARDGMMWLHQYLPAVQATAIFNRLTDISVRLQQPDEPRTLAQLRADAFTALMLDDACTLGTAAGTARTAVPAGIDTAPGIAGSAAVPGPAGIDTGPGIAGSAAVPGPAGIDTGPGTAGSGDVPGPAGMVTGPGTAGSGGAPGPAGTPGPTGPPSSAGAPCPPDVAGSAVSAGVATATLAPGTSAPEPRGDRESGARPDPLFGRGVPDGQTLRGVVPTVAVTVPVLTLLGHGEEPGHLEGYGPVDPATARELAARAPSFARVLTHPETGAVLSVGRDRYAVPADLKTWLRLRDETCRFPGCARRAARCDIDHVVPWHHGGTTDHDNLVHLCRRHHRLKHETGWTLERLDARAPTGRGDPGPGDTTDAAVAASRVTPGDTPRDGSSERPHAAPQDAPHDAPRAVPRAVPRGMPRGVPRASGDSPPDADVRWTSPAGRTYDGQPARVLPAPPGHGSLYELVRAPQPPAAVAVAVAAAEGDRSSSARTALATTSPGSATPVPASAIPSFPEDPPF